MFHVSGNQTLNPPSKSHFEKGLIGGIWKLGRQWFTCYNLTFGSNVLQEHLSLILIELKSWPSKYVSILRHDSCVKAQRKHS